MCLGEKGGRKKWKVKGADCFQLLPFHFPLLRSQKKRGAPRFPAAPLFYVGISRILFHERLLKAFAATIIHLPPGFLPGGGRLATRLRPIPGTGPGLAPGARQAARRPCLALHRMGFIVPRRSPAGRWAFTPPFHPCPGTRTSAPRRFILCDTFHRPELSPRPSANSSRHAALWCSDFPPRPKPERSSARPNLTSFV